MIYFASTGHCWFFNHQLSWEYNELLCLLVFCNNRWLRVVGGWVGGWGVNGPNIISGALFRQCYRDTIDISPQSDYCRQRTWNPHVSLYWMNEFSEIVLPPMDSAFPPPTMNSHPHLSSLPSACFLSLGAPHTTKILSAGTLLSFLLLWLDHNT